MDMEATKVIAASLSQILEEMPDVGENDPAGKELDASSELDATENIDGSSELDITQDNVGDQETDQDALVFCFHSKCRKEVPRHEFVDHLTICHPRTKKELECHLCGEIVFSRHEIPEHIKQHHSDSAFGCGVCDQYFINQSTLAAHRCQHAHKKDGKFICPMAGCHAPLADMGNLNRHLKFIHGAKMHQCSFCDRKFSLLKALSMHENIHKGLKPFICDICGKSFHAIYYMKNHMKHNHTEIKHLLTCPDKDCTKTFKSKTQMRDHMRGTHNKRYHCPYESCDFRASRPGLLKLHMDRLHEMASLGPVEEDSLALDKTISIKTGEEDIVKLEPGEPVCGEQSSVTNQSDVSSKKKKEHVYLSHM